MLDSEVLPIFPLGVVLLPAMPLPLHIFEEKYKQMIGYCLEEGKAFGVVYFNGEKFFEAGCSAEIAEVLQEYEDGRMNILTQGIRRFTINEILSTEPFITADVSYFDDFSLEEDEELILIKEKVVGLLEEIIEMQVDGDDVPTSRELDTETLSFVVADNAGFSPEEKQALLELCDTKERLEKSIKYLEVMVERLNMSREIDRIIKGNGHLLQ